ncbi:trypsin-like peptidase domain-containing protein [Niastella sp. MAH-29]|uniref:Trypsin-like peptidase domain-containing protein n=2 Tax=Chitinophagaceae TaxID=563835 RepID=A0ABS3YTA0_9BACT|nr:trypsin-like peptidase domain-containing protein [Niastella soli]
MMQDVQLLDAIERFLRGEMSPEEMASFEQLRKSNPEVDEKVVEHTMFLQQIDQFSEWKSFKSTLNDVHNQLLETGAITEEAPKATVIQLFRKYKRVMAVAASIAGITTLLIASMASYYTQKKTANDLQRLRNDYKSEITKKANEVITKVQERITKAPENTPVRFGGTGFLIDGKGYIVTDEHVVNGATSVVVQNSKGQEFRTRIIYTNKETDVAILKIQDDDFRSIGPLPYGIRKSGTDLGEPLFILGFPREEIVYNEGYMSAKTGYNGDTLSFQLGVSANPGNSGGPVFNKNGEVVGVITARQTQAVGVVFAVSFKNIFRSLEEVKKDTAFQNIRLTMNSSIKNLDRVQQIKRIEEGVFMVKCY